MNIMDDSTLGTGDEIRVCGKCQCQFCCSVSYCGGCPRCGSHERCYYTEFEIICTSGEYEGKAQREKVRQQFDLPPVKIGHRRVMLGKPHEMAYRRGYWSIR